MTEGLARDRIVGDRFKLLRCLGEGGMGEVWAAQHLVTKKTVALKFVKTESEIARKRFVREAMAASAVRHRNVVQVHDVLEHASLPFIVMDYLEGETLERRIARQSRLTLEEAADVMISVVSAVGSAHAEGIIHRDLKPANIFLTTTGDAIVLDFGIAKIICADEDMASSALTRGGSIIGTPHYMAPEQLFGEPIDHRIDVWALGVVFYECLSGKRPAPGENVGQILKTMVSGRITPIDELVPGLPQEVTSLVMRMLSPRAQRPELDEVMRVLRGFSRVQAPEFGAPRGGRVDTAPASPAVATSNAETATATLELSEQLNDAGHTAAPVARSARLARLGTRNGALVVAALVAASAVGVVALRVQLQARAANDARRDAAAAAAPPSAYGGAFEAPGRAATAPAASATALSMAMPIPSAPAPQVVASSSARAQSTPIVPRGRAVPKAAPSASAAPPPAAPPSGPNGAPILD